MGLTRIADLVLLGLDEAAARTYLALLAQGSCTDETVAELVSAPVATIRTAFAALNEAGLVSLVDSGAVASPVRPGPGLDMLVRRRETELRQARISAVDAYESFLRAAGGEPVGHLMEVLGGTTVAERIRQLERGAHQEIRGFDSPPYYADADANQIELDNLSRGVRYRVVYATAALERADYLADNVLPGVRSGEEARTLPHVPVKLMLFDDDCAVVSQSLPDEPTDRSALLIRPCSLLSALTGLFEMCWRAALPFDIRDRPTERYLQPHERRLLGLLAAGMGDDQAARALGVSRRTLFRYLEGMMARTGAANRFQLALHAARNGWI
ncbi:MAG TPA: helix-turn-helix domain-containing protein [Pseudonocardiaceae bacterium]|nr:helix-turn-helix domain-containing protein [Pseudonocardiaceae bacterium]